MITSKQTKIIPFLESRESILKVILTVNFSEKLHIFQSLLIYVICDFTQGVSNHKYNFFWWKQHLDVYIGQT